MKFLVKSISNNLKYLQEAPLILIFFICFRMWPHPSEVFEVGWPWAHRGRGLRLLGPDGHILRHLHLHHLSRHSGGEVSPVASCATSFWWASVWATCAPSVLSPNLTSSTATCSGWASAYRLPWATQPSSPRPIASLGSWPAAKRKSAPRSLVSWAPVPSWWSPSYWSSCSWASSWRSSWWSLPTSSMTIPPSARSTSSAIPPT